MNIGMLWFDNDQNTDLHAKVQRAAHFYQRKYGVKPDLCFVHPTMVSEEKLFSGSIEVRHNLTVLPNHFWIGVNGNGSKNGH